ncbi:MAG: methionyl-tRNA formyltransferase [Bacteroidetes bacterium]|nr:MAG: methionyl-tRNA formyltransferase [Bacteroidota bacterium]
MSKSNLRIIFMGTPDFAVDTLKALIENKYNVVGVITSPDKPAGRGKKIQQSAVKKFALEKKLNILQPTNLKNAEFIKQLQSLKADLQVIVAFRMLPEIVWNMPRLGSINLHASLLPQYRGSAPINWAIINGEKETGVSTFFLKHKIDSGDIIFQQKVIIEEKDNFETLHDKLMTVGSELILKTLKAVEDDNFSKTEQQKLINDPCELKTAPKIFKQNCKINWNNELKDIYNFIRGLSPYPAAWTEIKSTDNKQFSLKIFKTSKISETHSFEPGKILSDNKNYIKIAVKGGFISIEELQLQGKKRLAIKDFLRGFNIENYSLV